MITRRKCADWSLMLTVSNKKKLETTAQTFMCHSDSLCTSHGDAQISVWSTQDHSQQWDEQHTQTLVPKSQILSRIWVWVVGHTKQKFLDSLVCQEQGACGRGSSQQRGAQAFVQGPHTCIWKTKSLFKVSKWTRLQVKGNSVCDLLSCPHDWWQGQHPWRLHELWWWQILVVVLYQCPVWLKNYEDVPWTMPWIIIPDSRKRPLGGLQTKGQKAPSHTNSNPTSPICSSHQLVHGWILPDYRMMFPLESKFSLVPDYRCLSNVMNTGQGTDKDFLAQNFNHSCKECVLET